MESIIARVERKFPIVIKTTYDGREFKTQKVVIIWDEDAEYPSKILLEQWGDKKIAVAEKMIEGEKYKFNLTYRVNYWKDGSNFETAFWNISAWSIEDPEENDQIDDDIFPF